MFSIKIRGLEGLITSPSIDGDDLEQILNLPHYMIQAAQVGSLKEFVITSANIKHIIEATDNGWGITESGTKKLSMAVSMPNPSRRVGGGGILGGALGGAVGLMAWGVSKIVLDDAPVGPFTAVGTGTIIGAGYRCGSYIWFRRKARS